MAMRRPVPNLLAAALILAPLGAPAADLVVWWQKGYYAQEDEVVREIIVQAKRERAAEVDAEINQDQVDISIGLQRVVREIDDILQRAKAAGDDGMALTALRDMRQTLMDLAKLYGKLREISTVEVKILEAPQWVQLRAILGEVFAAHPAAGQMFLSKTSHLQLTIRDA
jgi:hypothetical protein